MKVEVNPFSIIPTEELLGSVTTFYPNGDPESGHALRTSARVKHKMRMDSIRGNTPPPAEKKDTPKPASGTVGKTPIQQKQLRVTWSNCDKNLFFDALNEYGKNFEAILNYINTKNRRKGSSEQIFKLKDVRHLYYQFNQKIGKYVHFSDEVKKEVQELYALINYGEMRKKVPFQNKKFFHKIKDLIYKGSITVREKGKNFRIKTPSCRALRKLNQLEEWQEEIRLPPRVDVMLKPATVEAWGRVQSLAQNPRVRTTVTLQRRVSSLLQLFELKWRHQNVRLTERFSSIKKSCVHISSKVARQKVHNDLELYSQMTPTTSDQNKTLCFTPSQSAVIHRPMINLTEFLSSTSICLNSYEQKIGVKVRGETLCAEKLITYKEKLNSGLKSQRCDGGTDNKKHRPSDGKDTKEKIQQPLLESFSTIFQSPITSNEALEIKEIMESLEHECCNITVDCEELNALKGSERIDTFDIVTGSEPSHLLTGAQAMTDDGQHVMRHSDNSNDEPTPLKNVIEVATTEDLIKTTARKKDPKEKTHGNNKRKDSKGAQVSNHFRSLVSEEVVQKIREGWTTHTSGDITVGDLYIMFGKDLQLSLEYCWVKTMKEENQATEVMKTEAVETDSKKESITKSECSETAVSEVVQNQQTISRRLQQLLLISRFCDKGSKKRNRCLHTCDKRNTRNETNSIAATTLPNDSFLFKQPPLSNRNNGLIPMPCSTIHSTHMRYKQTRWWRMRDNRYPAAPSLNNARNFPQSAVAGKQIPTKKSYNTTNNSNIQQNLNNSSPSVTYYNNMIVPGTSQPFNQTTHRGIVEPPVDSATTISNANQMSSFPASSHELALLADTVIKDTESSINLLDLSLPSTSLSLLPNLLSATDGDTNISSLSAARLLQELPMDAKLTDSEINDLSFSSFLGHLDSMYQSEEQRKMIPKDSDLNISIINESSVDYIARFDELRSKHV